MVYQCHAVAALEMFSISIKLSRDRPISLGPHVVKDPEDVNNISQATADTVKLCEGPF